MEPVRATVLMATYNGQNFIEEQINSINAQVGVQPEIFFSDDGSIDDTKKILAKYKNCFDLTPKNLNCGSAANFLWLLNKAASQDLGQYVFLVIKTTYGCQAKCKAQLVFWKMAMIATVVVISFLTQVIVRKL